MHGRGSQASAPASDAVGRGDAGGTPQTACPCRVVPRGDSRIGPTWQKSAPTWPKSGRLGLYRPKRPSPAEIQKKKKKKVQTHRFTNLKTPRPLTFRPASLTPSLISLLCMLRPSSLFSVFRALCECCVHTALLQPSGVLSLLFS